MFSEMNLSGNFWPHTIKPVGYPQYENAVINYTGIRNNEIYFQCLTSKVHTQDQCITDAKFRGSIYRVNLYIWPLSPTLFFFFLAAPSGMRDLNSPTSD